MAVLANIILPVLLVAGFGALAHARLRFEVQAFSKVTFYLFGPALTFDILVSSDVSGAEFGQIAAALVLAMVIVWGISELLAWALRLEAAVCGAFLIAILLGNAGNFGLPVNLFAFGEAGVTRAALFHTVNALLTSSLGVYLASRSRAISPREVLRQVLALPNLYVAILGISINLLGWTVPEPIAKAAHLLGQGVVPCSLMVLGAQIRNTLRGARAAPGVGHRWGALVLAAVGKLVLLPVVGYGISTVLGITGLTRSVITLQCAAPSAVMSLVLAAEFEGDLAFASSTVLVTTFASLLSVTAWLYLLM